MNFAAFCPRRRVAVVLEYGRAAKFVPYALARAFKEVKTIMTMDRMLSLVPRPLPALLYTSHLCSR